VLPVCSFLLNSIKYTNFAIYFATRKIISVSVLELFLFFFASQSALRYKKILLKSNVAFQRFLWQHQKLLLMLMVVENKE